MAHLLRTGRPGDREEGAELSSVLVPKPAVGQCQACQPADVPLHGEGGFVTAGEGEGPVPGQSPLTEQRRDRGFL